MNSTGEMNIVIAGANGFLGKALIAHWQERGHKLTALVRREIHGMPGVKQVIWDGRSAGKWTTVLENADLLINLSGRSVDCRYTERNKQLILSSRVDTTRALGHAIAQLNHPPATWINASSATIYRHAEDRPMTEAEGEIGDDFSMGIVKAWEKEFYTHAQEGLRQLAIRTSIVMGDKGGAFIPLNRLTRLGVGGKQGSGKQMVSWIHIQDFCRAIDHLIANKNLTGSINLTAPEPLANGEFMTVLRNEVGVSVGIPQPRWLLEIGAFFIRTETELLLKSRWVLPERLIQSGFVFNYPTWAEAVSELLGPKDAVDRAKHLGRRIGTQTTVFGVLIIAVLLVLGTVQMSTNEFGVKEFGRLTVLLLLASILVAFGRWRGAKIGNHILSDSKINFIWGVIHGVVNLFFLSFLSVITGILYMGIEEGDWRLEGFAAFPVVFMYSLVFAAIPILLAAWYWFWAVRKASIQTHTKGSRI